MAELHEVRVIGPAASLEPMAIRHDIELPTGAFSFSQFRSFKMCGACYEAQYVERAPRSVTPALVVGSAVHGALEAGRRARMEGGEFRLQDVPERAAAAFDDALAGKNRDGDLPKTEPVLKLGREASWGAVKDSAVAVAKVTVPKVLEAEAPFALLGVEAQIDMRGAFPFPFVAYADRMLDDPTWETSGHIGDDKTSGKDSPPDVWAAWQLSTYALPWVLAGDTVEVGVNQHIKTRVPGLHLWTEPGFSFRPSFHQTLAMRGLIVAAAERISAGIFEPGPNSYGCSFEHPMYPRFGVLVPAFEEAV